MAINLAQYDHIVSHFDGNNNDTDDIGALPVAAALLDAADLEDKSSFFYNNNLGEPNDPSQVALMRESAAFASELGIDTYDWQANIQATTNKLVSILNSGDRVLAIEGGPMEAIYRGLEQTSPENLSNITLLSHSSWNENRNLATKNGVNDVRTWSDIIADFPEVETIEIQDQNGADLSQGFKSYYWKWLDSTDNDVLQEVRRLMKNAVGKINDPSDAGMHFYAITGNESGDPYDAKIFFENNPLSFDSNTTPPAPTPEFEPIRLNAGGRAYTDGDGNQWKSDKKFVRLSGSDPYRSTLDIDGTTDDPLFQSERFGKEINYNIPIANGEYTVNLQFAEIYWNKAGKRIFDVEIENNLVIEDLDIYAEAGGKGQILEKSFQVDITDGQLDLDFSTSVNNAKVSAIEIVI